MVRRPMGLLGLGRGRSRLLPFPEPRVFCVRCIELLALHVVRCTLRLYRQQWYLYGL